MSVSPEEFTAALAKGSGQAMLLLRQSPDRKDLQDRLFAACVNNLAYDPQCENERSRYLADLISATGEPRTFFTRLLAILQSAPREDKRPDVLQIFAILVLLALDHPELDPEALRRAYAGLDDEEDRLDCLDSMVRLDGLPAFLTGVETLGANLQDRSWRIDDLVEILREREGSSLDIAGVRAAHPILDRLMTHAEAERTAMREEQPYDFDDIRANLRRGLRPQNPWAWLRRLTDAEWRLLAQDLAAETDADKATIYLRLFARRDFPSDIAPLLRWAEDDEEHASSFYAVSALSRLRSPSVRTLALKLIEAGRTSGARALRSSFEPGDFARLERLLDALSDIDKTHDLGLSVLEIVSRRERPPEATDILLRLYELTPCSQCRNDAVTALAHLDATPRWMAEECRFDADPDTVKLFAPRDAATL